MTDHLAGSPTDPPPSPAGPASPGASAGQEEAASEQPGGGATSPVTVYWRPGCGFCQALTWELDRVGLETRRRNIWEEPEAAAFVRSVARGNETVPTVTVGPEALVNPSARQVLAAVRRHAPDWLPAGAGGPDEGHGGRVARAMRRVLGEAPGDQGK